MNPLIIGIKPANLIITSENIYMQVKRKVRKENIYREKKKKFRNKERLNNPPQAIAYILCIPSDLVEILSGDH